MATGSEEIAFFPLHAGCTVSMEPPGDISLEPVSALLPPLVDAPLFCLSSHAPGAIRGRFLPYRYYYAGLKEKRFAVHPLGVSGVTIAEGALLVGRRAGSAPWDGYVECVPSGGIEERAVVSGNVDCYRQLLWELEEEAGIAPSLVQRHTRIGLFYSPLDGVYDIGILLELEKRVSMRAHGEYASLEWMPFSVWEALLEQPEAHIMPLSKALWREVAGTSRW